MYLFHCKGNVCLPIYLFILFHKRAIKHHKNTHWASVPGSSVRWQKKLQQALECLFSCLGWFTLDCRHNKEWFLSHVYLCHTVQYVGVTYVWEWRRRWLICVPCTAWIFADRVPGSVQISEAERTDQQVWCTLNRLNLLDSLLSVYIWWSQNRFLCSSLNSSSTWIIVESIQKPVHMTKILICRKTVIQGWNRKKAPSLFMNDCISDYMLFIYLY